MELEFVKLNGLGNDFIVIDDFSREIELDTRQVTELCDRHFGIGADGVILVRPSENPECAAYMHYINSDGSLAEMCGNGVRCFAKYLVDRGYVSSDAGRFMADTLAGPKAISFEVDKHGNLQSATVDMGVPSFASNEVPTLLEENSATENGVSFVGDAAIETECGTLLVTCVSMGNPHAVCFIDDGESLPKEFFAGSGTALASLKLDAIGPLIEGSPLFPEKTNVEFVERTADGLSMRVFERGCGETLACGTGACAVSVAATATGRAGCVNDIRLPGGTLHIEWNDDNHVIMTGSASEYFSGRVVVAD